MPNRESEPSTPASALNRRRFVQYAALSAAGAALPGALLGRGLLPATALQADAAARPDILVLLADDQTFNTIRMLGNSQVHTPNLDALAARGTTMSHCFNQGGWHGAICMASRAMMATGRGLYRVTEPHSPRAAGHLQTDTPLWAEHFRDAGYKTFGTGKWHNGDASFVRSFSHGDAVYLGGMHPYSQECGNGGGPIVTGHEHVKLRHYDGDAGTFEQYDGEAWSTDCFVDAARAFVTEHAGDDAPLFTYVSFTAPHDPHHAPPEFRERYADIELPPNFMREHPFDTGDLNVRDEIMLPTPRDPDVIRSRIGDYLAMVTHIDDRLGDLFDTLEQLGRLDNTVIVFTADHGLAVGQHGLLGKQNLYDHSVRVPMVWSGPGIPAGEVSDELVYLHALYATTCDLAGLDVPDSVSEPSLVPILGGVGRGYESIFCGYRDLQRMVRTQTHKLIRYNHNGEFQLFDMTQDPWEVDDLAEDPAHADRVRELDAMLRAWQVEVGDTLALEPLTTE